MCWFWLWQGSEPNKFRQRMSTPLVQTSALHWPQESFSSTASKDVDSANNLNYQNMFPLNEGVTVYISNPQEGLQGSPLQNSDEENYKQIGKWCLNIPNWS